MEKTYPLNTVKIDREVKIKKVNVSEEIKRRILDLGMIEGTKIKPVLKSPSGDPTAYEVRGSVISIREEEASQIEISLF